MERLKPPKIKIIEQIVTWGTILIWVGVLLMAAGLVLAYLDVRAEQQAVAQAESLSFVVAATTTPTASPTATASPTPTATHTPTPTLTFAPLPPTASSESVDVFDLAQDARVRLRARTPMPTRRPTLTPTPTATPTHTPQATSTPGDTQSTGAPPDRIVIPSINLDAPVLPVGWHIEELNGQKISVWDSPDYAAGWHKTSAYPGNSGNVVLNGHNNIRGEVFRYLIHLEPEARVLLYVGDTVYQYYVSEKHLLKERGESAEVRYQNAQWIVPTEDERLTLVTCWPYTSNTHRLIIVARPYQPDHLMAE